MQRSIQALTAFYVARTYNPPGLVEDAIHVFDARNAREESMNRAIFGDREFERASHRFGVDVVAFDDVFHQDVGVYLWVLYGLGGEHIYPVGRNVLPLLAHDR